MVVLIGTLNSFEFPAKTVLHMVYEGEFERKRGETWSGKNQAPLYLFRVSRSTLFSPDGRLSCYETVEATTTTTSLLPQARAPPRFATHRLGRILLQFTTRWRSIAPSPPRHNTCLQG